MRQSLVVNTEWRNQRSWRLTGQPAANTRNAQCRTPTLLTIDRSRKPGGRVGQPAVDPIDRHPYQQLVQPGREVTGHVLRGAHRFRDHQTGVRVSTWGTPGLHLESTRKAPEKHLTLERMG